MMSASTSSSTSFPASGSFIASVRNNAEIVRKQAGIQIPEESIDKFLRTTLDEATFNRLKTAHGASAFPLNFPSLVSEINFLSILSLLNTLSGYRLPLHAATGDGAYQNVTKILLGLFISGDENLSAKGLKELKEQEVAGIMGVSLFSEKPHDTLPGVTVGVKGGLVAEAVGLIVKACNETGEILVREGYDSLGDLVVEILDEAENVVEEKDELAGCDHFVERLVTTIPGFADQTTLSGTPFADSQPTYIYKKAFFLLFVLYQRLDPRSPALTTISADQRRRVPDIKDIPMFIDNVLCTMLVHWNIIDLSESSVETLALWGKQAEAFRPKLKEGKLEDVPSHVDGPSVTAREAYVVRSAAIEAGKRILEHARKISKEEGLEWLAEVSEADIDGYIWAVAKDDAGLRKVPRMVERGTIMY